MHRDLRLSPAERAKVSPHLRDVALARLATRQHGVVAHAQLVALGFSASAIGRMLTSGRLHRVMRTVYALGHAALHPLARWKAATLAGGHGAVLSHRPAAALRALLAPPAGRIDITVPGCRGRGHAELRVHSRPLAPVDVTKVEGIPCTSTARTLLDLATVVRPATLLEACEQTIRLQTFDLAALAELLDRCRGARGTRPLTAALGRLTDDPDLVRSELERRLRELVQESWLPDPRVNRHVRGASGALWEVDLHWAAARLVVEADGSAYHSSRAARERDARKQADLEAAGWAVDRVGWRDVTATPEDTLRRFGAALRQRPATFAR